MARTPALLAIDAGTTAIKTVAFGTDGDELAKSTRENSVLRPASQRAEQDMDATWAATSETIEEVVRRLPPETTPIGLGLTAQGDGCWLIDEDGEPVRNAILWSDSRTAGILDEWETEGRLESLTKQCGSALYPGTSLPLLKWLARKEPTAFDRIRTVFSCKDWLRYRLTGERAIDRSEATVPYLDKMTETYNPAVLEIADLPEAQGFLPPLVSATDIVGTVTEQAGMETGLPEGLPVVAGLIDVGASAIGSGAATPGVGAVTLGTSLVSQTLTGGPQPETAGVQMALGIDGLWTYAIGSNAGTPSLDWILETVVGEDDLETLEERAASVPVGSDGLVYHPYLSTTGERGPFVDSAARAQFVGLTPEHTTDHLARAVYEGLSLAVRDCVAHLPSDIETVHVSGGGSRSDLWCQLLADCVGAGIVVPQGSEFGAKGAAAVLGVALEEYSNLTSAIDRLSEPARRYTPRPAEATQYAQLYDLYREIRERMEGVWGTRAATFEAIAERADEAPSDE
jgi:xylulokinase